MTDCAAALNGYGIGARYVSVQDTRITATPNLTSALLAKRAGRNISRLHLRRLLHQHQLRRHVKPDAEGRHAGVHRGAAGGVRAVHAGLGVLELQDRGERGVGFFQAAGCGRVSAAVVESGVWSDLLVLGGGGVRVEERWTGERIIPGVFVLWFGCHFPCWGS